jgi:hypothetical protein
MSEYVNLAMMIQFLEQCGYDLKYDDFRRTFEEKIDASRCRTCAPTFLRPRKPASKLNCSATSAVST